MELCPGVRCGLPSPPATRQDRRSGSRGDLVEAAPEVLDVSGSECGQLPWLIASRLFLASAADLLCRQQPGRIATTAPEASLSRPCPGYGCSRHPNRQAPAGLSIFIHTRPDRSTGSDAAHWLESRGSFLAENVVRGV